MNLIQKYLDNIIKEFNTWRAREHSYRPALKELLESINDSILATNEPARESCWAPDFIITDKKNIPRWYIEAKDIVPNILDDKKNQAQINKYFDWELWYNFIHTDNIKFRFYRNAELVETVKIAELQNNKIIPKVEEFEKLEMMLKNFLIFKTQTITSSKKLSEIMAWKARMIKRVIYMTLKNNKDGQTEIHNQFEVFKKILVHDLDETGFADIYAQTITYWLFTARLHDPTLPTFDRDEAAQLLPKSNPFLKKFFQSLRDDLDPRIEWIVDDLIEIFLACDVKKLLEWYWKTTSRNDPIIHFYEDFLAMYDSKLRKAKWVYYTPEPVVNFMIRWVDYILKKEFNLSEWIADTSKTTIEVDTQNIVRWKIQKQKKEVHKVQILDPATGTGTFLNDIIKYIYETRFSGMTGIWKNYVDENLLPRLHGFEIMMASYAMAHLKLDLTLQGTWYKNENQQRLWIYLTNSLEEAHYDTWTLFANWLSHESTEANHIKKDMPIMTIIWNPPYSWESSNNWDWIMSLIEDYKKEPEWKIKLQERNSKWINDDYVKFIRFSEYLIEKNREWILAFINPHGFLDNPTFRWMRWKLLSDFDSIYTIDLHWNSKKKEVCPDWSVDQNVFDIMQWVSINFFIKWNKKKKWELAKVYHYDLYWKRDFKYNWLQENSLETIKFNELPNKAPNYFMVQKDFELENKYNKGFSLNDLFLVNWVWITTAHDDFVIKDSKKELLEMYKDFQNTERNEDLLHQKFNVKKKKWWEILKWYDNIKNEYNLEKYIKPISYRPFDDKYIFYEDKLVWRTVRKIMWNFIELDNMWLVFRRQQPLEKDLYIYSSKNLIADGFIRSDNKWWESIAPLYLYQKPEVWYFNEENALEKVANFDISTIIEIEKKLNMTLSDVWFNLLRQESWLCSNINNKEYFTPEDLFDYIYAVLHSKTYRETYKEFLKIDFPKVPFDCDKEIFFKMVELWRELRSYHLMENENLIPKNFVTTYPVNWDNEVWKVKYTDEKVFINETQYFEWVPSDVWEFYIWWYQPAQKWLKDRKERSLTYEDILHYSKIILSLKETIRIMEEIEGFFKV